VGLWDAALPGRLTRGVLCQRRFHPFRRPRHRLCFGHARRCHSRAGATSQPMACLVVAWPWLHADDVSAHVSVGPRMAATLGHVRHTHVSKCDCQYFHFAVADFLGYCRSFTNVELLALAAADSMYHRQFHAI
jgi:hypothetical protein